MIRLRERELAEADARRAAQLDALMEHIPEGIILADAPDVPSAWSAATASS